MFFFQTDFLARVIINVMQQKCAKTIHNRLLFYHQLLDSNLLEFMLNIREKEYSRE